MLGGKLAVLEGGGGGAYTESGTCVRKERWAYLQGFISGEIRYHTISAQFQIKTWPVMWGHSVP